MEVGCPQTNHLCVDPGLASPLVLYHLGIYEECTIPTNKFKFTSVILQKEGTYLQFQNAKILKKQWILPIILFVQSCKLKKQNH